MPSSTNKVVTYNFSLCVSLLFDYCLVASLQFCDNVFMIILNSMTNLFTTNFFLFFKIVFLISKSVCDFLPLLGKEFFIEMNYSGILHVEAFILHRAHSNYLCISRTFHKCFFLQELKIARLN